MYQKIGKMTQIDNMLSPNIIIPQLIVFIRYVFQWVFVTDGNFKADHVQAKTPSNNIWLSEGGVWSPGMSNIKAS